MQVQAVIEPATEALEDLASALAAYDERPELDWLEPDQWLLKVAAFGQMSLPDEVVLDQRLRVELSQVGPLHLRLHQVVPLPEDGDNSVWVELDGELDALAELASAIPRWVRGLGFVLDRRSFRARIKVAGVNEQTSVPFLEALVRDVGEYAGPTWRAGFVSLAEVKAHALPGMRHYQTHSRLPFAGVTVQAVD